MAVAPRPPVVLVPACNRLLGQHPFHVAGKKYIDAVRLAGCLPFVVPTTDPADIDAVLDLADGVLLTGSPSNVHPRHFGEDVLDAALPLDADRDGWTLPLIPRVLVRGIPLLAICRGLQETNVALGGSLHQAVHAVDGRHDHRGGDPADAALQYGPAHAVDVLPGGVLDRLLGDDAASGAAAAAVSVPAQPGGRRIVVNSVHGQGVDRLADGLRVEATAPDGQIEAFSVPDAAGFALCLQWHPEWQAADNPVSRRLFAAFGDACRRFRSERRESPQRHRPGAGPTAPHVQQA